MKRRHEALVSLSHHHHHALVVALKLTKAGEPGSQWTVEEVLHDTINFWKNGGNEHFREEEEILLPTFAQVASVDLPEIKQMLIDHVVIRAGMDQLMEFNMEIPVSRMKALGKRLQEHVRLEERHIFPVIEEALDEETLSSMKDALHLNFKTENEKK